VADADDDACADEPASDACAAEPADERRRRRRRGRSDGADPSEASGPIFGAADVLSDVAEAEAEASAVPPRVRRRERSRRDDEVDPEPSEVPPESTVGDAPLSDDAAGAFFGFAMLPVVPRGMLSSEYR